jgi:alkylated DNA repair dioxygenase AlkB
MPAHPVQQLSFDRGPPALDESALARARRVPLEHDAWIEHVPSWVTGQDGLLATLASTTRWREETRPMYDRMVMVPRLVAVLPDDGPGHPLLEQMRAVLSERYRTDFARVSLGYYRWGADSVAWHGDTIARELPEALVATVSLGGPRRFLLRPRGGGRSLAFSLGFGDLFVMGGTCQRTWQHAIPKVAHAAPRISVMFRPIWTPPSKRSDGVPR